jgi:hypothetical protein
VLTECVCRCSALKKEILLRGEGGGGGGGGGGRVAQLEAQLRAERHYREDLERMLLHERQVRDRLECELQHADAGTQQIVRPPPA